MPLLKSSQSGLLLLAKMSRNRPERYTPKLPPTFSFVTITNPKESKTQSKKRAVRSHVAYYQHHKNDDEKDDVDGSSRSRKLSRRVVIAEDPPRTPALSSDSSSESLKFQVLQSGASAAGSKIVSRIRSSPITPTFSGTRVDQFQSYPVPWKQHYDSILDFYLTYILIDTPSISREGEIFLLKTAWLPFMMKNPTTFYAALAFAASVYYKRSLSAPNLLELRQKAISGINESLSKMEYGPDDFTIGAVLCMSLLESMYGDSPSYCVHMMGLQRMVEIRGGLKFLGLEGLLEDMIVWVDFHHAKVHKSDFFFRESADESRRPSPFLHPRDSVANIGRTNILR